MADLKKLLDHPEKQGIITRLVSGETPKAVAAYLKSKYPKPDEGHLRIPASTLKEFIDTYGDHYGFIKKIVKDDRDGKLDKQVSASLLANKDWKDYLDEVRDEDIDFRRKWMNLIKMLEVRLEQVFDKIQENPGNTKPDYVMEKYINTWMQVLEKADKMINERPDVRIEHSYTVQMVEQQTVAFQEAIKRVLERLDPELSTLFVDLLNEELANLKVDFNNAPVRRNMKRDNEAVDKLLHNASEVEGEFVKESP
jgi:hypothetical protein